MLTASAALLIALVYYTALCALRPFAACRKCRGLGQVSRFGKPRICPRCHDRKLRLRLGRRAFNAWLRTHRAGTRPAPTMSKESR
ncbi:hypothetical protein [Streptomyces drozdowiczii]|uniref:hypothetical protein n=1 Tax=Streptomyces drozdowiczii TaxID=202862 RepID=UPI00403CD5B9